MKQNQKKPPPPTKKKTLKKQSKPKQKTPELQKPVGLSQKICVIRAQDEKEKEVQA